MHPFASGTNGIGFASVELESETVSCFSISIAGLVSIYTVALS
jgi:hypothetical protein